MAKTARDLIERARSLAKIQGLGESLGADDAADGLADLNELLSHMRGAGIILAGVDDWALTTDYAALVPREYHRALRYLLAVEVSRSSEMAAPKEVVDEARRLWRRLSNAFADVPGPRFDRALTTLGHHYRSGYDIDSDQ